MKTKGFTLIELLVGIAIIGVAVAFALSTYNKVSPQSQSPTAIDAITANVPDPSNYAVDEAGVLSAEDLASLNTKLKGISDSGKEIAVLVVKSTAPLTPEAYGIAVGDKWKVGKAGKDNGVILIVATQDRKIRIEVGHGAEANITDSQAGDIIANVIAPQFKQSNWAAGINAGVDAISAKLQ